MKKLLLVLASGVIVTNAEAQFKKVHSVVNLNYDGRANKTFRHTEPIHPNGNTANKTTAGGSRWLSHVEAMAQAANVPDIYDASLTNAYYIWQDSSVTYPAPDNTTGIQFHSIGQIMHPQASIFSDIGLPYNSGQIFIGNTNAYTLDSITILGYYDRLDNSYDDTLIFTIVNETAAQKHAFFSYGGSVFTDHGVDSFCAQLWGLDDYQTAPINQVAYGQNGNYMTATEYKVPLTQAVYEDSTTDGFHKISIAPNLAVLAGRKASVSVTFKSGTAYTAGTSIDNYNNFLIISHETSAGGYVYYLPEDFNMSSFAPKDSQMVNATLGLYVPTIAYTAPLGGELHNISYKVTCPTCFVVGVNEVANNVNVSNAYPNPATDAISIPFTTVNTADVKVVITNAVGATIATQDLGKYNANQSGYATFNVAHYANGVYFYTVEANGQRVTKRFVVTH